MFYKRCASVNKCCISIKSSKRWKKPQNTGVISFWSFTRNFKTPSRFLPAFLAHLPSPAHGISSGSSQLSPCSPLCQSWVLSAQCQPSWGQGTQILGSQVSLQHSSDWGFHPFHCSLNLAVPISPSPIPAQRSSKLPSDSKLNEPRIPEEALLHLLTLYTTH